MPANPFAEALRAWNAVVALPPDFDPQDLESLERLGAALDFQQGVLNSSPIPEEATRRFEAMRNLAWELTDSSADLPRA